MTTQVELSEAEAAVLRAEAASLDARARLRLVDRAAYMRLYQPSGRRRRRREAASARAVALAFHERWGGTTCSQAWPASRFAWCPECLELVPSKQEGEQR